MGGWLSFANVLKRVECPSIRLSLVAVLDPKSTRWFPRYQFQFYTISMTYMIPSIMPQINQVLYARCSYIIQVGSAFTFTYFKLLLCIPLDRISINNAISCCMIDNGFIFLVLLTCYLISYQPKENTAARTWQVYPWKSQTKWLSQWDSNNLLLSLSNFTVSICCNSCFKKYIIEMIHCLYLRKTLLSKNKERSQDRILGLFPLYW